MAITVLRHSPGMYFMIHDYEYACDLACIKLELHECYDLNGDGFGGKVLRKMLPRRGAQRGD